ncbi:MAG: hypothetical protein BWX50_00884 [Euryarchaeota archaeon ADurb.Bin009]|nr:MAG: hypothetical protein BWX50_00884 [Euryarchaeota archaeon ADurb.Bin009]
MAHIPAHQHENGVAELLPDLSKRADQEIDPFCRVESPEVEHDLRGVIDTPCCAEPAAGREVGVFSKIDAVRDDGDLLLIDAEVAVALCLRLVERDHSCGAEDHLLCPENVEQPFHPRRTGVVGERPVRLEHIRHAVLPCVVRGDDGEEGAVVVDVDNIESCRLSLCDRRHAIGYHRRCRAGDIPAQVLEVVDVHTVDIGRAVCRQVAWVDAPVRRVDRDGVPVLVKVPRYVVCDPRHSPRLPDRFKKRCNLQYIHAYPSVYRSLNRLLITPA